MSIKSSIEDMKNIIINKTQMLYQAWEIEFVGDVAIRVMSIDPVTFEYSITDGNETFRCYNENLFATVLSHII